MRELPKPKLLAQRQAIPEHPQTACACLVAQIRRRRAHSVAQLLGYGFPIMPAQKDARRLAVAGATVRFLSYPTTHKLHPDMLRDVNRWIMSEITADADAPLKD